MRKQEMAIPLESHLEARRQAPYHVQVEIVNRPVHLDTTGSVTIKCRVGRVFRTTAALEVGGTVSFKLPVYLEREGMPTCPFYLPYRRYVKAVHLEVYLEGTPPQCRVACEEFCIIDGFSETPVLNVEELERFKSGGRTEGPRKSERSRFWRWLFKWS